MDHKNLTHCLMEFTTQCVLCWHLLLEEFNPTFLYQSGPPNNTSNDDLMFRLSSYPSLSSFLLTRQSPLWLTALIFHVASKEVAGLLRLGQCPLPTNVVQQTMEDIFLEHPVLDDQGRLPFQYKTLFEYQQEDPQLLELPTSKPQQYRWENMGAHMLVCHYHNQHNHICLTNKMLPMIVDWFHKATAHNMGIT